MATRSHAGLAFLLLHLAVSMAYNGEEHWQHAGPRMHRRPEVPALVTNTAEGPVTQESSPAEGTGTVHTLKENLQRTSTGGEAWSPEASVITSSAAALASATIPEEMTIRTSATHMLDGHPRPLATTKPTTTPAAVVTSSSATTPKSVSSITSNSVDPTPDMPIAQEIECFRKCPKIEGHMPVCGTNGIMYPNLPALLCVKLCHSPDIEVAYILECDKEPRATSRSEWRDTSGERRWRQRERRHSQPYATDDNRPPPMQDNEGTFETGVHEYIPGHGLITQWGSNERSMN